MSVEVWFAAIFTEAVPVLNAHSFVTVHHKIVQWCL